MPEPLTPGGLSRSVTHVYRIAAGSRVGLAKDLTAALREERRLTSGDWAQQLGVHVQDKLKASEIARVLNIDAYVNLVCRCTHAARCDDRDGRLLVLAVTRCGATAAANSTTVARTSFRDREWVGTLISL